LRKILSFRVHYTWIIVFALVTIIVTTQFSADYPLRQRIFLGVIVSLLFLAAATIRELIISLAALHGEIPYQKITLLAFGGVYKENKDIVVSTHLLLLFLARFLSNLVIAAVFYGLYATFINAGHPVMAGLAQWLAYIYFLLFLLHFIPAFPLDGGEILRMVLLRSTGDYYKSTHLASMIGWATGLFLMFAGVLILIVTQQWLISLLIIVIGWTIQIAAGSTRRQVKIGMVLQNIKTADVMTREYPEISTQVKIGQLIREHILIKGWLYIIVVEDGKLKGILTLNQIKSVRWKRWNSTTVGDVMTPSDHIRTAHPLQTTDTLYSEMYQRSVDYIPVLEDDNVIGVVTRSTLMNLVKVRSGFGD
jgi:Zn-dependent protease/predicted transcriptional regulator